MAIRPFVWFGPPEKSACVRRAERFADASIAGTATRDRSAGQSAPNFGFPYCRTCSDVQDGITGVLFGDCSLGALLRAIYRSLDIYHSPRRLEANAQGRDGPAPRLD